jgi:hypothetical protein
MSMSETRFRRMIRNLIAEALEEDSFTYAVAKAAIAGKKTAKVGDKEVPVKMSKEKAQKIVDEMDECGY